MIPRFSVAKPRNPKAASPQEMKLVRGVKVAVVSVDGTSTIGGPPRSEATLYRCSRCGGKSLELDGHPACHGKPARAPETRRS